MCMSIGTTVRRIVEEAEARSADHGKRKIPYKSTMTDEEAIMDRQRRQSEAALAKQTQ